MVGKLIKGEYTIINIMQRIREENRFTFACFVNDPVHLFDQKVNQIHFVYSPHPQHLI